VRNDGRLGKKAGERERSLGREPGRIDVDRAIFESGFLDLGRARELSPSKRSTPRVPSSG
jgi:hypothetical protein